LGICAYNTYEGQCAMLLEDAAARALDGSDQPADVLALAFHRQVARMILDQCNKVRASRGTAQVALTGGVFQNRILMEETLALLRVEGFSPYYNISVSPNDGGIALGQAYVASHLMNKKTQ
jgi:hydrogenase maturation protein HypF